MVARAGGWRRDTLALLATVLFQAKLVSITVGAAVADASIPIIARRTVVWACRAIHKTTCRPPAIVARFIGGPIGTVAWCSSHAVLARRARIVGTVALIAALGPARGDRSSSGITPVFRRPFWPIGIVFCVSRTILLRSKVVAGKTCKDVARDDVRSRGG